MLLIRVMRWMEHTVGMGDEKREQNFCPEM